MYSYTKDIISPKQPSVYIFIRILGENDTFPSLNIFDAFELDVKIVNFVYYGKTRVEIQFETNSCVFKAKPKMCQNEINLGICWVRRKLLVQMHANLGLRGEWNANDSM